ncbi:hypothetical protein ACIF8T_21325 [Streptomyces sp. NPDC085946]|uniref:hypothetical protein n=1 Tax=Streptomyces sp. NPDC085946 TaxID=3365744 RepID=UPI0037CF7F66
MTAPFCRTCAEALLGPAVVESVRRTVKEAPPLSTEQLVNLRALFESARASRGSEKPRPKPCGHDRTTSE